jgi:hypothetical protein
VPGLAVQMSKSIFFFLTGAHEGSNAYNSKAGSSNILTRFVSMRSIKEDFVGSTAVEYPSNEV